MPNCFSLTRKGEDKPTRLATVDEELCGLLERPVDEKFYVCGWFDSIGLALALGKTWDEQREIFKDSPEAQKIITYLEANYTANAWYQHGYGGS